jgi:hypothetical protein
MSAVGFDCFGDIFVGWEDDLGIAHFDPEAPPPGLTYLNEGLGSLSINKIQINNTMSAPAIFVSTDAGAFYSYDYMVGVEGPGEMPEAEITVYPNPAKEKVLIGCDERIELLLIYNSSATLILKQTVMAQEIELDVSGFSRGIYFVEIQVLSKKNVKKLLVK